MRWLLAVGLVGCTFHTGRADDVDAPPGVPLTWTLDTTADFAGSGFSSQAVTIEPTGMLTPAGYVYGGLMMYGVHGTELWSSTATLPLDFGLTSTVTPDGAALWTGADFDTSQSLANVGIMSNDVFSLWMVGEVYLGAQEVVSIDADGAGFIDLYIDGRWQQMAYSPAAAAMTSPAVSRAGWYPVRIGYGEGTSSGHLIVRHGPSGSLAPFTRDTVRGVASEVAGTMRLQFDRQIFGGAINDGDPPISHLEQVDLLASLPDLDDQDWSARWFGQIHIDQPGTYNFVISSDDGNELYAGTTGVSTQWAQDLGYVGTNVLGLTLEAGWNDLMLDYNQGGGNESLSLMMNGAPVPLAQLRPVEPRRDRLVSYTVEPAGGVDVPNDTGILATLNANVAAYPSEVVTSIDVTIELSTQHRDQLVIKLQKPGGSPVTIQNHVGGGAATNLEIQLHITDQKLVGGLAAGTWVLGVGDDVTGGNSTSVAGFELTLHTNTGPEQVALTGTYVSPVKALGGMLAAITDVAWTERAPLPSDVALRACSQPDCSDNPPWTQPLAQHASASLPVAPYIQAMITLHSDGTKETELDRLDVTYEVK
jgi:subtilisin-like proprotein convertase family protein